MIGKQHIEISNRNAKYKFDLNRNITIVCGNSGTGKTTLFQMVYDHTRLGAESGVTVSCAKPCVALTELSWRAQLSEVRDSIVFIDEGSGYIASQEFAEAVKRSNNYYVIFNRRALHQLPYSVEEIYEIRASGKYHRFERVYKTSKSHVVYKGRAPKVPAFETVLTEDSKSGYQFLQSYFKDKGVVCQSSESNSKIFECLRSNKGSKVFALVDGAAFGSQIDRVMKLRGEGSFWICAPESFEWMILKSGLVRADDMDDVMGNPSEHIESGTYFSWENFFEHYLIENTVGTSFQYSKSSINPAYLVPRNAQAVMDVVGVKR